MKNYLRGSEWRRWDLHIHTPGTQKNDQYEGRTLEEKWERYYSDIEKYIGDGSDKCKAISVIGITDYLSIDNYKKVLNDNRLSKCVDLILPNVEMRIQPMASESPVNIHFIFDPQVVDSLDSRFFAKLEFSYGESTYSARKDELIRLGRQIKINANDEEAYKLGINQFVLPLDNVKKVFAYDSELRESTIIGVSNSTTDGVSGIVSNSFYRDSETGTSQLTLFRQSVYQFADFIFSANENDRKYFLGEKSDSKETVIQKCRSLKPCIHGSDAHNNSKIFEPDEKRYCWIKADPTFNGLRQMLYEPKDRVRISQLVPETKPEYHIIDKVVIEDEDFSADPILFNDKLTCIVGGKSTGKSILLHNLAYTIDKLQVCNKIEKAATKTKMVKSMKVYWADGTMDDGTQKSNHKIVYIPQTYLNRLSDENEETTEIDKIIEEIVLLDENTNKAFLVMGESLKNIKPKLDKSIYDVVELQRDYTSLLKECKEIGTRSGIEKEIEKLKKQKDVQSKALNLSEDDIKKYDEAIKSIGLLQSQKERLQGYVNDISDISAVVKVDVPRLGIIPEVDSKIDAIMLKVLSIANSEWELQKKELLHLVETHLNNLEKTINENIAIRDSLQEKIIGNEALAQLTDKVQAEEEKLKKFLELDELCNDKKRKIQIIIDSLASTFPEYSNIYKDFACVVNKREESEAELEFSVSFPFRNNAFCEALKKIFDNRVLKTKKDCIDVDNFEYKEFAPEKLKELILMCLNGDIPLVRGNNVESALRSILSDWFNITYNVKMDGDKIEEMSPGKKALVLLRLLISLAESNSPILIDQPEDDLDNRSIADDLISFIKEKKVSRQIIVVTHNANVVLGGDAEEIIVANQKGKNSPNNKYRFEYRSGAIENESPYFDEYGNLVDGVLYSQGIAQHICDVLEGGVKAFDLRKNKYRI